MSNIAWGFTIMYDFLAISFLQYQETTSSSNFAYTFFVIVTIQFFDLGLAGKFV
jgi:hypothetical protein